MSARRRLVRRDFRLDHRCWQTEVEVPCWRGYQSRGGPYGARDSAEPSDGTVQLVYAPEGRGPGRLWDAELAALQWALDHAVELQGPLLTGLLAYYRTARPRYVEVLGDDLEVDMPRVATADGFKALVGLHAVFVHQIEVAGLPYVGFEFGCTWDIEHGLGVLMHGTRVVEVGYADTAMTLWMAKADAKEQSGSD